MLTTDRKYVSGQPLFVGTYDCQAVAAAGASCKGSCRQPSVVLCCAMQAARLRDAEPALLKAAERAAAAASVTDKVVLNAAAEERKAKLRQQEVRCCQHHCMLQIICQAALVAPLCTTPCCSGGPVCALHILTGKWRCLGDRVGTEAYAVRRTPGGRLPDWA
jgi:hypothetical protein